eukprot:2368723-Rhodomonas_salina.1
MSLPACAVCFVSVADTVCAASRSLEKLRYKVVKVGRLLHTARVLSIEKLYWDGSTGEREQHAIDRSEAAGCSRVRVHRSRLAGRGFAGMRQLCVQNVDTF